MMQNGHTFSEFLRACAGMKPLLPPPAERLKAAEEMNKLTREWLRCKSVSPTSEGARCELVRGHSGWHSHGFEAPPGRVDLLTWPDPPLPN
jgi:hypothetical protein